MRALYFFQHFAAVLTILCVQFLIAILLFKIAAHGTLVLMANASLWVALVAGSLLTILIAKWLWSRRTMYQLAWQLNGDWSLPLIGHVLKFTNQEGGRLLGALEQGRPRDYNWIIGSVTVFACVL